MGTRKVAFPADGEGLDSNLSGHFGHVASFTTIEFEEESKDIQNVEIIKNAPHEYGGCMRPVMLLKNAGVTDIIVGGIGARPLMGFIQVGINPFAGMQGTVKDNFQAFLDNKLQKLEQSTCSHH